MIKKEFKNKESLILIMETFLQLLEERDQDKPGSYPKIQQFIKENPDLYAVIAGNLSGTHTPSEIQKHPIFSSPLEIYNGLKNRTNIKNEINETMLYRTASLISKSKNKSEEAKKLLIELLFEKDIKLTKKMYEVNTIDDILNTTIYGLIIKEINILDIIQWEFIVNLPISKSFMTWISHIFELNLNRINMLNYQSQPMDEATYKTEFIINKTILIIEKLIQQKTFTPVFPPNNHEKYYKLNDKFNELPNILYEDWVNGRVDNLFNLYLNLLISHLELTAFYNIIYIKEYDLYQKLINYETNNSLLSPSVRLAKVAKHQTELEGRKNNIKMICEFYQYLLASEFFVEKILKGIFYRTVVTYDKINEIPSHLVLIIERLNIIFQQLFGMMTNVDLNDSPIVFDDYIKSIISSILDINFKLILKEDFLSYKNFFLTPCKLFDCLKEQILKQRLSIGTGITVSYSDIVNQLGKIYIETNKDSTDINPTIKIEINRAYHRLIDYFLGEYSKTYTATEHSLKPIFNAIFSDENKRERDNYLLVTISNINDTVDNLVGTLKKKNLLLTERGINIATVRIDKDLGIYYVLFENLCEDLKVLFRNLSIIERLSKKINGKGYMGDHTIYSKLLQMFNGTIYNLIKIDFYKDTHYVAEKKSLFIIMSILDNLLEYKENLGDLKESNMITGDTLEKLKEICSYEPKLKNTVEELEKILNEKQEKEEDLPEEFLDPITYIPMKNPVILPSSGIMVDRGTIVNQLLHNSIDPYSRAKLTVEELEEHNSKEEVKEKIKEYWAKLEEWRVSKSK